MHLSTLKMAILVLRPLLPALVTLFAFFWGQELPLFFESVA